MTDIRTLFVRSILPAIALCAGPVPAARAAESSGRITGVGGIFFKSKDP